MNRGKNIDNNYLIKYIAILLAISPILDPYILIELSSFTIRLLDIPLILLFVFSVIKYKYKIFSNKYLILLLYFLFLSMLAAFNIHHDSNILLSFRYLGITIIYSILTMQLININDKKLFIKYVTNISLFTTTFLLIQFIFVNIGFINFFDGKIPFLELSKYDGWAGLIDGLGNVRVHSLFQEPSFFGIYTLPVFTYFYLDKSYFKAFYSLVGLIVSSSLLAIVIAIMIIFYNLIIELKDIKSIRINFRLSLIVILILIVLFLSYVMFENFAININYLLERLMGLTSNLVSNESNSNKLRVLGNLDYFRYYNPYAKLVGVGAAQYGIYLSEFIRYNYSSTVVTIILDYGIIGISIFLIWCVMTYLKLVKINKNYFLIFLLICLVDHFWFSWYFYYLTTWFLNHKSDLICEV